MIRLIRDTPNWPRDVYQAVRQLDDGDTLVLPHDQAAAYARQLATQHGHASTLWFCEVRSPPPATRFQRHRNAE